MKFKITLLAMLLAVCNVLVAQNHNGDKTGIESDNKYESKHFIGAAAGTTGGYGVMYSFKPNRFTLQTVFLPNIQKDSKFLSAGLNFHFDIKSYPYVDLYVFQNNRLFYEENSWSNGTSSYRYQSFQYAHAAGLGLTLNPLDHFGMTVNSGFGLYGYERFTLSIDAAIYFKI